MDLSGRVVHRQVTGEEMAWHQGELEMSHLPAGTYLVQVRLGHHREVRKVVKQ
jgi:hypothetical protein